MPLTTTHNPCIVGTTADEIISTLPHAPTPTPTLPLTLTPTHNPCIVGTTAAEITRLNKMQSSNIFSRQYVLVPRPPNYVPDAAPITSMAVLVALRKRRYGARFSAEIYTRGCHWIPRMFA